MGLPILLVLYFWGSFFLFKQKWTKALGVILFLLAYIWNFIMMASPYDTQEEFKSTRIFILFGLAAGTFLIFRRSITSRIFGILIIITTILAALMGSIFMSTKLNP